MNTNFICSIAETVELMRVHSYGLCMPIKISAHSTLSGIIQQVVDLVGIPNIIVVTDDTIQVMDMGNGRRSSDILFESVEYAEDRCD